MLYIKFQGRFSEIKTNKHFKIQYFLTSSYVPCLDSIQNFSFIPYVCNKYIFFMKHQLEHLSNHTNIHS